MSHSYWGLYFMCYKCCFLSNKILVVISLPLGATKTTWLRKSHTHTPPHTQCCRCALLKNGQCLICQPCECWSKGLGGGPIPVCPPGLTDSPFIWLKRLSSFMLLSCMPSMDWKHNEEKKRLQRSTVVAVTPPIRHAVFKTLQILPSFNGFHPCLKQM